MATANRNRAQSAHDHLSELWGKNALWRATKLVTRANTENVVSISASEYLWRCDAAAATREQRHSFIAEQPHLFPPYRV